MYNRLITAQPGAWKKTVYEYERGRSVREYTDDALCERFKGFTKSDIEELMSLPCLFAYEGGNGKARIGWITRIKARSAQVRLEFEIDEDAPQISGAKLKKLTTELDITDWELNRTHWAVKDVNLVQVLKTAHILTDERIRALAPNSKIVRVGMTTPVSELQVRPSVFRVPPGKVEEDLVSVMMPLDITFNKTFDAIKAACASCSLRCQRADDIWHEHEIIQDVFSLIYRSRVVICDFIGRNPNVFYETGIGHTLGKTVIPIAQSKDDVPFDLRHLRFIKYLGNGEGRKKLTREITQKLRSIRGGSAC
jgi:hypothetical protein